MTTRQLIFVGAFREFGYESGATILELRGRRPLVNKAQVVDYLRTGALIVGVPGREKDAFDPSLKVSLHILTDGRYAWHQGLSQYVDRYEIELPDEFEQHMARNSFRVPAGIDVRSLKLPDRM